jgi:hypothetical protein
MKLLIAKFIIYSASNYFNLLSYKRFKPNVGIYLSNFGKNLKIYESVKHKLYFLSAFIKFDELNAQLNDKETEIEMLKRDLRRTELINGTSSLNSTTFLKFFHYSLLE